MVYTVTFNPAIDYVACLDGTLKIGQVNRNQAEDVQFGGKGINVSCVLNALGVENVALGFIAGFTGQGLSDGLAAAGIRTDFVTVKNGLTRINVKLKADHETEINGIGPEITASDMDAFYEKLDILTTGDYLVLSGSVPASLGEHAYENVMARLSGRGVRVVVDGTGRLLRNTLQHRPFLIKPNHHELEELFGFVLQSDAQIAQCGGELQRMGAKNVLISMAERGALLLDEFGVCHRIACPSGQVVNSVGAGDSMVAGFLAGYIRSSDYNEALRLGVAAGSATAFSLKLADKDMIDKLLMMMKE